MDNKELSKEIEDLDFISDRETADAAIHALMGMLMSKLEQSEANKLIDRFPVTLDMEKIRHQQTNAIPVPVEDCIAEIGRQFRLDAEQAILLANKVLHALKESLGDETLTHIERQLPVDWILAIEKA